MTLAAEVKGEESVLGAVAARLGEPKPSGLDPSVWVTPSQSLDDVRAAIGAAAKGKKLNADDKDEKKGWFKLEESGELLGGLLIAYWDDIADKPLGLGLRGLYAFVYGEALA